MNRRSVLAVVLFLTCALSVTALIFSVAAPINARSYTAPVIEPPAPRFAPFDGLPAELPADLRAAHDVRGERPTASPDVILFKWTPGNQARPGGVVVYSFYFANQGPDAAANVIITDVLPAQTTYAGDTSGLPATSSGGVITWTIGAMPARTEGSFNVTLNVDPAVTIGSTLPDNCARISTTTSGDDPANNEGCAGGVNLVNDSVDISVQTWPGGNFDAAAGQEYPFILQICNFNGTPAGPVRSTDTLPLSTTFSRWQATGFWPTLWILISTSGNQVVFETPGFPANSCDEVRLFALVDPAVPQGSRLLNQLRVYTPDDTQPDNDGARNDAVRVRVPRVDLHARRRLSWGPFGIETPLTNEGNTAVTALLTDTLPLSATVRSGSGELHLYGGVNSPTPITPTVIDAQTVVWNLGTLPVGYDAMLHYELAVEPGAPGPLAVCGTLAANTPDDTPWNNTACIEAAPLSAGAHVQIARQHEWRNDYSQLRYELRVLNTGYQPLSEVRITDTYPLAATMQPFYDVAATTQVTDTWDAPNRQRVFWIEQLQPGELARIWVYVNLDDPLDRPQTYTNTLSIDAPTPATVKDVTTLGEFTNIELRVNADRLEMWGNARPNVDVRVTSASGSFTTTTGRPWSATGWDIAAPGGIQPGDTVTVEVDGGAQAPIVLHAPAPFNAAANSTRRRIRRGARSPARSTRWIRR